MKTPALSIIITLALGINLLRAATWPNRITTNNDAEVFQHIGVNVLNAGARGGTNDDTAALNAILSKGGSVVFPPTNYTVYGPLYVTNNSQIWGYGSTISLATNLTGVTNLVFGTNVGNVLIQGLAFNGGNTNDCYTVFRSTNTDRVFCNPSVNQHIIFRDVTAFGYDLGIVPAPWTDGITVQELPRLCLDNVRLATNAYSIFAYSTTASTVAEYLALSGLIIHDSSYGIVAGGGNIEISTSLLSHNNTAILVDGTANLNPGHCSILGNVLNHGNGQDIVCNNLGQSGEYIQGNIFAAGTAGITISNCANVVVTGNHFRGGGGVIVRAAITGGTNYVYGNDYTGTWKNPGFTVFDFVANSYTPTTNLVSWDNLSIDTPGSDDPYKSNPYAMQSLFITSTNMPPANSYTPFGSFLWESNGVYTYKLRSGANAAWTSTNILFDSGMIVSPVNGFATITNSAVAPATITFPSSGAQWTNTFGINIGLYIDNTGVTGTTLSKNGQQIFSSLVGDSTILLKPGDYFTEAYTVGTPTARWEPR